ncbi:MAG: hypothetical protein QXU40_01250, partial [Candidatus Pacearchaeota archaeon]
FNITYINETTSLINFTPTKNDAGNYTANISVMDNAQNYSCPHKFCEADYNQTNKTSYQIVNFTLNPPFEIDLSECQAVGSVIFGDKIICRINVTTRFPTDEFNLSSTASLRNFLNGRIYNASWFLSKETNSSTNYLGFIWVNVTPSIREVGNWSINISGTDSSGNNFSSILYFYVNWTQTNNSAPLLDQIQNRNISIELVSIINITAYDTDLLIPDKNESHGGYNETLNFSVEVLNLSSSTYINFSNFSLEITDMPLISGGNLTNKTLARIVINPLSNESGNYTLNLSVRDKAGALSSIQFNLSIVYNEPPKWNLSKSYIINHTVNFSFSTTQPIFINLTGEGYLLNTAGEGLNTSFTNLTSNMIFFSISNEGVINFTPYKEDVGIYNVSIEADYGGLKNTTTFTFNITNINTNPKIESISGNSPNVTISGSTINTTEGNFSRLSLFIRDDDLRVRQVSSGFYENLSIELNILKDGVPQNLFNFSLSDRQIASYPDPNANKSKYLAEFTPNRTQVGTYDMKVKVVDINGASDEVNYVLNILSFDHPPQIFPIANQSSSVGRRWYYQINASHIEDGFSNETGNTNFTFNYSMLNGTDIFRNSFNYTKGIFNITFNQSQAGYYKFNITVESVSSNKTDFRIFSLKVYDSPTIIYPTPSLSLNFSENETVFLNISVNHTLGDDLLYTLLLNNTERWNGSVYGNSTNSTINFTPNFTDETYNQKINLTLIVMNPIFSDLNSSVVLDSNITHTNSPITFCGGRPLIEVILLGCSNNNTIEPQAATYNTNISINLSNYFSDIDAFDPFYNQSINFSVRSNETNTKISWNVSSWILTLTASEVVSETLNITGSDLNGSSSLTNSTSNNFLVRFTEPTTKQQQSSGSSSGGGSSSTTLLPISFKLIFPDKFSLKYKTKLSIPITLWNNGSFLFKEINLSATLYKDGVLLNGTNLTFDKPFIPELGAGKKENLTLSVDFNDLGPGFYEINILGVSKVPLYSDWGKVIVNFEDIEVIKEKILFLQDLIVENPECLELKELLDEVRKLYSEGKIKETEEKLGIAIRACTNLLSYKAFTKIRQELPFKVNLIYVGGSVFVFLTLWVLSYYYKRARIRRYGFNQKI